MCVYMTDLGVVEVLCLGGGFHGDRVLEFAVE